MTLFSSIFFFVNTFPKPSPTPTDQFSASLVYAAGGGSVSGINILHLAGPSVPGTSLIYLSSAAHPTRLTTPFSVSQGIGGATLWTLGQTWSVNLTSYALSIPDNITVSIVTNQQLLFRVTLPGASTNIPPTFVTVGTIPTDPSVGQAFTIYTQIVDDDLNPVSVFANLSQIPGITGTGLFKMTFSATNGTWSYYVKAGTTSAAGSFFAFVNATDQAKQPNSVAFTISIEGFPSPVGVLLTANPAAPVNGSSVSLIAYVENLATNPTGVTVQYYVNGASVGNLSGTVPAGSTGTFVKAWTPTRPGVYLAAAFANSSGGGPAGSALNLTVYPSILLLAHNVPAGVRTASNGSSFLAQEMTAAGFPFSTLFVPCNSAIPTSIRSYNVVVIDFGNNWGYSSCPKAPSATDQGTITGSTATRFWVLGSNGFGLTACNSYSSAYFAEFGIKWTSGSTCTAVPNATASATWTSATGVGLRGDGMPSPMTINGTLAGSSRFIPYASFSLGTSNGAFLTAGASASVGSYGASGGRVTGVALATSPALLTAQLPNGNNWGTGTAGASVVYNVLDALCGLSTSGQTGRALTDFAVAQATLLGQSHSFVSTVYVGVRSNGPLGGAVTATLFVNGTPASYNGAPVTGIASLGAGGQTAWVTLFWVAPGAGSYSLSIELSVAGTDLYSPNDQIGLSILNQPIAFT